MRGAVSKARRSQTEPGRDFGELSRAVTLADRADGSTELAEVTARL